MSDSAPAQPIQTEAGKDAYPSPITSWGMVSLLFIAYVFSYVDRGIIGYLIEPIKADLGITDEQFGLINGAAFAIFYATMAIPIGWVVDRRRRTWILSAGISLWSLATAASGLATNFWQLFLARLGVGAGEASLGPAAISMIGDAFPPEKRAKPIAFYTMALTVGGAAASGIAAIVLGLSESFTGLELPLVGEVAPWQMVFFMVGLPGLLLALVFFFVPEPARSKTIVEHAGIETGSFPETLKFLGERWGTFLGFISLVCVMTIMAYGQTSFLPGSFERSYGWAPARYAYINFWALLILGPLTYILVGYFSDRWSQKGIIDAPFRILIAGFVVMVPTGTLALLMPTGEIAYAMLAASNVGIAMISASAITAMLLITPPRIRGQLVALYYMTISMTGLFLGPTTVGSLSTRVFGEENLHLAVAALPVIYGLVPMLALPFIRRLYLAEVRKFNSTSPTPV